MQYNSHATNQDCVSEVLQICNATTNSYSLANITRRFNGALDRFFTLAFQSDGRWSFDDMNQSTAPIETINLVSGTEKYALDTFTSEIINVLRVEMLDSTGQGVTLHPLDVDLIEYRSLPQYNSVAGTSRWYNKLGKYIYLYPKPNYNSTNGLTLYFERNKVAMASTDTTKVPGIPSLFHMYLCRVAALPYLMEKGSENLNAVMKQIGSANSSDPLYGGDELAIVNYFSHRDKDIKTQLQTLRRSSR